MEKFIVVTGDPVKGFSYIGVFNNKDAATEYADKHIETGDWWVSPMDVQTLEYKIVRR